MSMANGAAARKHLAELLADPATAELPLSGELTRLHGEYLKLERRFNKVAHISDLLQADLKQNQAALKLARREAEAASIAKSRFLANMSHELRTPLAGIIGALEMLTAQEEEGKKRGLLQISLDSADSLLRILNEILDLAKVESGRMEVREHSFCLDDLLAGVVELYQCNAKAVGVELRYRPAPGLPEMIRSDRDKLEQILRNLLGNAVKFTPRGWIELRAEPLLGERLLRLTVADSGIGIPEDFQARVFDNFTQVDDSHSRKFAGAGLGLAIVKQLVELLGGTITLASRPGEGTVFTVDLPCPPVPATTGAASLPRAEEAPAFAAASSTASRGPIPQLPRMRLLVVDDVPMFREYLAFLLPGQQIDSAASGSEALAMLADNSYDAILMDIQMPDLSGLEVTARLRKLEAAAARPRTPVIALTAHAMPEEIPSFFAADMDGHVAKPVERGRLYRELLRVAGGGMGTAAGGVSGQSATAAGSAPTGEAPILLLDREAINSEFRDEIAVWHDMIIRYLARTLPEELKRLSEHLAAAELKQAATAGHRIKGVLGLLRAPALAAALANLEIAANEGRQEEADRIMAELPAAIAALHREIADFMGS